MNTHPFFSWFGSLALVTLLSCGRTNAGLKDYQYETLESNALLASWKETLHEGELPQEELDRLNLHVRAIFAHRCFQCHSTSKHKGALVLDTKEGVFAGGDNGAIIEPGDANASEIVRRIKLRRNHDETMPPEGDGLASSEIETIALWIDQGAKWADQDLKIFREAKLSLGKPNTAALDPNFTNPVDRWVDHYFQAFDISWPAKIDDRRFIRRAYLDVIGLLPTVDQIAQFISDDTPNKREKLIDDLLNDDKKYTEHWLSFWNDLLRNDYSGTGFITNGRKQISDWLYAALYENLPYDSMVHQLINPSKKSEGFIQGIKWRGAVNASQSIELQAAQNISQSLLGVNLKCASCHNSFVNNVTLQDAYNFAQIFIDSSIELYRCDVPTGVFARPSFLYPELGEVVGDSVKDRLASLAKVIVQPDNGRLYRTVVNRYWERLLGRGLVAPVDEMDNPPWSQDLLDWLAADFRDNGSDLRHLLKTILTSDTYQLPVAVYPDPNYLRTSKFVFRGPVARRMSAEQTADAFSHLFAPMYHSVAFDPDSTLLSAKWIWHRQVEFDRTVLPYPGERYFRRKFDLKDDQVALADVLISVDHDYTFYLNGQDIGKGDDWRKVDRYQIADKLQRQNIIAIKANNDGEIPNPAGVLFGLKIEYANGQLDSIFGDSKWVSLDEEPAENWKDYGYVDTSWQKVWTAGSLERSHWGRLLNFNFDETDSTIIRAALVALDPFLKGLGRPVRENVTTSRESETTLLQSLLLSNNAFLMNAIKEGARAWMQKFSGDKTKTIRQIFNQSLGRDPNRSEEKLLLKAWQGELTQEKMEDLIWSIMLLPEFQFI